MPRRCLPSVVSASGSPTVATAIVSSATGNGIACGACWRTVSGTGGSNTPASGASRGQLDGLALDGGLGVDGWFLLGHLHSGGSSP